MDYGICCSYLDLPKLQSLLLGGKSFAISSGLVLESALLEERMKNRFG